MHHGPPGTQRPRRFRPRFHWELLACGVGGHALIGIDAVRLRPEDAIFAREEGGLRWYRCVRCDSWVPLPPPAKPRRDVPPNREEIVLPLRGRALRDKVVLRIIAVDRALHFVVLAALSVALFLFAAHEIRVRAFFYRVVNAVQGGNASPSHPAKSGLLHTIERLLSLESTTLYAVAAAAAVYAVVEGLEAIGLWYQKRWAEYLTFVVTCGFLPYEIYELTKSLTTLKIVAFALNLAIAGYLLYAKRLFGLRGGGAAEEAQRAYDTGWQALERTAPSASGEPPA